MTLNVFNDPLQAAGFVLIIILTPLCILATVLRFVASWMTLHKTGKEDWLALGSLAFYLAWIICLILIVPSLNGTEDILSLPIENTISVLKDIYVASLMFPPNQLCAKLSILFLYHRIFAVNKTFAIWIKILGVLQFLVSFTSFICNIFQCRPIHKAWDPRVTDGWCVNIGAMLAATETLNSLIDFAMAIFAVLALRGLQTTRSTKWKLAVVFTLAGLAGVIGFIKIGLAFEATIYNQLMEGLWATIQMAFSVFCCCSITYMPLLARIGNFEHIRSKLYGYGSKIKLRKPSSAKSGQSSRDGWIDIENADQQQQGDSFKMGYPVKTVHIQQSFERI
ncbi:integral membrane protein [Annulohypoxylon bovei var. microspora]|nr:integral membrane protein [Annulohypoxylon bovei var. microspora]